jgi:hypothetical protein
VGVPGERCATRIPEPGAQGCVDEQALDRRGEPDGISRLHDEARLSVAHESARDQTSPHGSRKRGVGIEGTTTVVAAA